MIHAPTYFSSKHALYDHHMSTLPLVQFLRIYQPDLPSQKTKIETEPNLPFSTRLAVWQLQLQSPFHPWLSNDFFMLDPKSLGNNASPRSRNDVSRFQSSSNSSDDDDVRINVTKMIFAYNEMTETTRCSSKFFWGLEAVLISR